MDEDFLRLALELRRRGLPFATATVVRVEPPTSAKPGDRALVAPDGRLHGWIGGSCARPTVLGEARAALRTDSARLVRLSAEAADETSRRGVEDRAMTCFSGGTMEIFIEPHLPAPKLLVVGGQPVGRALVRLGDVLGYRLATAGGGAGGATDGEPDVGEPGALAGEIDPLTFVVVASHGDDDEAWIEAALSAGPPYVGLVSSPRRAASIREHLAGRGFGPEALDALRAPAGLDLGARRPEEIALSIVAEIISVRRAMAAIEWPAPAAEAGEEATAGEPSERRDPVCGMTVEVRSARHVHEHGGSRYYFCCAKCLTAFAEDPARYAASGEGPARS